MTQFIRRALPREVKGYRGENTVKDVWTLIEVTDDEERSIRRQTLDNDMKLMVFVEQEAQKFHDARYQDWVTRGKQGPEPHAFTEKQILEFWLHQTKHLQFCIENYVDGKIAKGEVN